MESKLEPVNDKNYYIGIIEHLLENYKNNDYMMQRFHNHLTNLPYLLENENKKNDERNIKTNELIIEQNNFYVSFLEKYKFFYLTNNSKFYEYDGKHYRIVDEDVVRYSILSNISLNPKLIQWKYKTSITLLKKIKNISIFSSTPEEFTIQNVLSFLQIIFFSQEEIIYFLCVIGDCILKKNNNLLYFIKNSAKKIISAIDYIIYMNAGFSISNNFILKHHDTHNLTNYRLIKTKTTSFNLLESSINDIGLDLICVGTYYSELYKNSENYIFNMNENNSNYILFFIKNTPEQIINNFISSHIEIINNSNENVPQMNWKNMHYIWKLYLHSIKVPTFSYINNLQQLLMNKLEHATTSNEIYFNNVTSKYLPNISSFLDFWNENITIYENENESFVYDYTATELLYLYKMSEFKIGSLNEKNMLRIIQHYFSPQVCIINEKYVKYIKCKLWLKEEEINEFLNYQKYELIKSEFYSSHKYISLNQLYDLYKKTGKNSSIGKDLFIGKDFFQTYVSYQLQNYMNDDNTLIDLKWIEN